MKKYDLSKLRTFHLVGERSDPDTIRWLTEKFPGVFLNDSYWQTETGWPICSNFDNLHKFPTKAGSATKPCVGYEVEILGSDPDDHDTFNKPVPAGVLGNVSIKLPMPPSFMLTLWKNDQFFIDKYLTESPGYYHSGDAGNIDEDGYLHIMTRTDDVLNCAGHRLSAGWIEEVINSHDVIVESACIAFNDPVKGEVPFAFIVRADTADIKAKDLISEVN